VKIAEKLDELRNNILRDTSDLIAGDDDALWSDESLIRYIKLGERKFARQTLCLRDSTTPIATQVKLKSGTALYPLHESVIAVLSARYDTNTFDLARSGHAILSNLQPPEFLYFDPTVTSVVPPGNPSAFNTDETLVYPTGGRVSLMVSPVPGDDQDGKFLYLRVLRVPLTTYSVSSMENEESEIPEDFELDPLQWAAHLAMANHDGDAGSSTRADKFAAAYNDRVANCVRETKRKIFGNMSFRFGAGGFSWQP
jgi:hypothetical protein